MIAGVGGIVALVIAYRRQRGIEEGRFMSSLESAARQLGAEEPTVQFAGIYALAALADESRDDRKQKCVDVLCAYLRLPYIGMDKPSLVRQLVEKHTWSDGLHSIEETKTHQYRPADKEVRLTIIREISARLRKGAQHSWSALSLDFTGAVFDGGDFIGAQFAGGRVIFDRARFTGGLMNFAGACFTSGIVSFNDAHFAGGHVNFFRATFDGAYVMFIGTRFTSGSVRFQESRLEDGRVSFNKAGFDGGVVDFKTAGFFGAAVNFTEPRSWGRPPSVPWEHGKITPRGVSPSTWP